RRVVLFRETLLESGERRDPLRLRRRSIPMLLPDLRIAQRIDDAAMRLDLARALGTRGGMLLDLAAEYGSTLSELDERLGVVVLLLLHRSKYGSGTVQLQFNYGWQCSTPEECSPA